MASRITVRIEDADRVKIEKIAKARATTISDLVRVAILRESVADDLQQAISEPIDELAAIVLALSNRQTKQLQDAIRLLIRYTASPVLDRPGSIEKAEAKLATIFSDDTFGV